ncbi:hypothetical protein GCM10009555_017190 [Acrocarpospora macrocephala]|uniref:Uncharacterized protein n=1 Tax=Acrocarpospora macrocephala TaxID=150177 RepID=A0A5M3WGG3_9ACTN|nr:hypothetical protein [Acrocarpospora macrocephala]GES07379.1 hypothetical protein Amac_009740 [Acrocarpospora macrocephala]
MNATATHTLPADIVAKALANSSSTLRRDLTKAEIARATEIARDACERTTRGYRIGHVEVTNTIGARDKYGKQAITYRGTATLTPEGGWVRGNADLWDDWEIVAILALAYSTI